MSRQSLPQSAYWAYGFGDFGQNIIFQVVAFYLLFYLTEVAGVSAGFVGSLFLIGRVWDGINDPVLGVISSRTQTRWGSYRPYLLWGAPLLAAAMYWLFAVPDGDGKSWYVAIAYLGFGMAFTFYNVPYGSLTAVMTSDYHERGRLTGFRMTFAMIGGIVGATCFLPLVSWLGDGMEGYRQAAALFAVVIFVTILPTFFTVRERIRPGPQELPGLSGIREYLGQNAPFWWLCLAFGSIFAAYSLFAASLPYATRYLFQDPGLTTPLVLVLMSGNGATVPVWTWLSRKIGKRNVFLMGAACYLPAFLALSLIPIGAGAGWAYAIFGVMGIGFGSVAYTSWAMLPDTIEFGKWRSGKQAAGITYGVYGVFFKLGLGVGAALAGWVLAWAGYEAGMEATTGLTFGIRASVSWIPLIFAGISWLAIWKYPISAALHQEIREYLESLEG